MSDGSYVGRSLHWHHHLFNAKAGIFLHSFYPSSLNLVTAQAAYVNCPGDQPKNYIRTYYTNNNDSSLIQMIPGSLIQCLVGRSFQSWIVQGKQLNLYESVDEESKM